MFKIGDKVVYLYGLDRVGIVRTRYRHHYLVSFPGEKWGRIQRLHEKTLIGVDSPLFSKVKEIDKHIDKLEGEIRILENQLNDLAEGKK